MSYFIEKHKDFLSLISYYGTDNFGTNLFITMVVENLDDITNDINNINSEVKDLMSFYQYLWVLTFKSFVQDINNVNIEQDIKEKIIEINKSINSQDGSFVNYVNENYKFIFDEKSHTEVEWYNICNIVLKLIYTELSNAIQPEVFSFLEQNMSQYLLVNFEICKHYYSKTEHKEGFEKLFHELKTSDVYDEMIYVDFLLSINENFWKPFLKEQSNFICQRALKKSGEFDLNSDTDSIISLLYLFNKFFKLSFKYKLNCCIELEQFCNTLRKLSQEYIQNHGFKYDIGRIDLTKTIEAFKSNNNILKFLQITHTFKNNELINSFNDVINLKPDSVLIEFATHINKNTSDKYQFFKQSDMELVLQVKTIAILSIISDEQLMPEFARFLSIICSEIDKEYFNGEINIRDEILGSFEIIRNIITLKKEGNKFLLKALENGCAMNLCGTIEKILRKICIKNMKNEVYVDVRNMTLLTILNQKNALSDLSQGLLYYLEFYLITELNNKMLKCDRPGKNIRNEQMHNYDNKYDNTDRNLDLKLFVFILSILGDLFKAICYNDKNSK